MTALHCGIQQANKLIIFVGVNPTTSDDVISILFEV